MIICLMMRRWWGATVRATLGTGVDGVRWRSVGVFVLLAFALSWGTWIGLRAAGVPFLIRAAAGMFGPAVAAVLTRRLLREGFRDMGLRPLMGDRVYRWYLIAWGAIPLLLGAGLLLGLAIGFERWNLLANVQHEISSLVPSGEIRSLPPVPVLVVITTAAALTITAVEGCILTTGEELGWRGHLLVRLAPLGEARAAVGVGVVWGLWHSPLIVLDGYEYPGHLWFGPFVFCLFTIPVSVILAWLRLRSGTVWPGVLAHSAINAQALLVVLALSGGSSLVAPPVGILGMAPFAGMAVWLVATGRLRSPQPSGRGAPGGNVLAVGTPSL
jgi:membrane protease YdiL (CAAX protease family)